MGTIKKKMMKNDENGQLSCGIYSSPAAAHSPLQGWVGDRWSDRSITGKEVLSPVRRFYHRQGGLITHSGIQKRLLLSIEVRLAVLFAEEVL